MTQVRFVLKNTDLDTVGYIPPNAWLYFEATIKVNDFGSANGILSTRRYPHLQNLFQVENGQNLDYVLEVYYQPTMRGIAYPFVLLGQFLLRYSRTEQLNDGRPRQTPIFRSPLHLLHRPLVYPRTAIPPAIEEAADALTGGATPWPWTLPTEDDFTGETPPNVDTVAQMRSMVERAKVTNPTALDAVTVATYTAGGIPVHPIKERYTTLLAALQAASLASWHEWYQYTGGGVGDLTQPPGFPEPVDFDLVPDASGWVFTPFIGGRGEDRRLGYASNPIVLSPTKDNVIQPVAVVDRLEELTKILVGGKEDGRARDMLLLVDPLAEAGSPWNSLEAYWDSREIEDFGPRYGLWGCSEVAGNQIDFRIDFAAAAHVTPGSFARVQFEDGTIMEGVEVITYTVTGETNDEVRLEFHGAPVGFNCITYGGPRTLTVLYPDYTTGIYGAVAEGRDQFAELGIRHDLTAIPREKRGFSFMGDFFLGDIVTIAYNGQRGDRQLTEARLLINRDGVLLDLGFSTLQGQRYPLHTGAPPVVNGAMVGRGMDMIEKLVRSK